MTKHLLLLATLATLVSVSACNRVVDLLGSPDGGYTPLIDAAELPYDGGFGSLDIGFGTIDAGPGPDGLPDASYALPDAPPGALDASFATAVRTRT